jgi:predicted DNA-binding transcriptional regulator AlpA
MTSIQPRVDPGGVPAFVSKARLARELDMAESTVDEMVKRGVLPRPARLSSGCIRWDWSDIVMALCARKDGAVHAAAGSGDPYMTGAHNVTQISEGHRGAS